jgi:hypothetical protein
MFTICAKNYIGLAQALEKSVKQYNSNIDFFIVVADEFNTGKEPEIVENVIIAKNCLAIDENLWTNMSFKYNITEFCTSIKPFCIEYFFTKKGYETVCYMDPDTYLFSDFSYIHEKLEKFLVVTTPHVTIPDYPYSGDLPDRSFLFNGISNFGFGGFRNHPKTINLIKWWENRLSFFCFGEMLWAICTDQKWTDFFPAFLNFDEILLSNNLGLNVAPWNYYERKIVKENETYYVVSRTGASQRKDKLVFCHFAGYNYGEMSMTGVVNNQNRMRINNLREYLDVKPLIDEYVQFVYNNRDLFNKFLSLPYSYGSFDNGIKIDKLHRRLYNGIVTNFGYDKNPFDTKGSDSFYSLLKKKRIIYSSKSVGKIDDISKMNDDFAKKLKILYMILRFFYKLIGYKNYVLFLQFIRRLSLYDNNTFLLGKDFENFNLK